MPVDVIVIHRRDGLFRTFVQQQDGSMYRVLTTTRIPSDGHNTIENLPEVNVKRRSKS